VTSLSRALAAWPALEGGSLPPRISYERGVWGKLPGSSSDYKWIATSSSFPRGDLHLEKQLVLGSEDTPRKATHWRSLGDLCLAMATYPSRSTDAAGRSGFLEKQVFAWRRAEAPAALGALVLLPKIAQADAGIWWYRNAQSWMSADDTLVLLPQDHGPFDVAMEELEEAAETGLAELGGAVSEEALAELYAHLLAEHRAVPLTGLDAPLGPEALAALLLPLPRKIADGLSLAGWLPSQRISNPSELQSCWNAALGGDSSLAPAAAPAPEHRERGRKLARAVFSRKTAAKSGRPLRLVPAPDRRPIQLALWGASAAGKTALLAQLYLGNLGLKEGEWNAYPAPGSGKFFKHMRSLIRTGRTFPPASPLTPEPVEYRFLHRQTGVEVPLRLEDRAGSASSELTEDMRQHLNAANGLVLLFDPNAQGDTLHGQVLSTLEYLKGERAGKDSRPIAVCLSKADLLIETVDDLRHASEDPDSFVRRYVRMDLAPILDYYCTTYRFFPVSAAGVRVRYGVVESVVFYDNDLRPRIGPGGSPINVMAPFAWLLREVTKRHE
jgi:hypothetical protein